MLRIQKLILRAVGEDRVGHSYVMLPPKARILDVRSNGTQIVLAVLVEADKKAEERRRFFLARAGEEVPGDVTHLCSFTEGSIVYHVFEKMSLEQQVAHTFRGLRIP